MNKERLKEWLLSRKRMKERRSSEDLFIAIREGDPVALSMAITLLESQLESEREQAKLLIEKCLPFSGNSIRIGITGVPGVGKSSFIEKFGEEILKSKNKLAVLAIDPSSEKTGGSILGDKTRMENLSQNSRVFIRPSASGTTLGGVARKTRETIILCEAAGFDVILIETVGVGQSETVVHSMVDFFLLLLLAGAGDELQGIKRGIMEMADGLVVTKCDGDNVNRSRLAASELRSAIKLFPLSPNNWNPQVILSSSMTLLGLDKIWKMIADFESLTKDNTSFFENRKRQNLNWLHETLRELYFQDLWSNKHVREFIKTKEEKVKTGETSAFQAAEEIFRYYINVLK